jgi:rhodanese-related sulfurtransferase
MSKRFLRWLVLMPVLLLVVSIAACSDDDGNGPSQTDFEVVLQAVNDWLDTSPAAAIAPATVYDDIVANPTVGDRDYFVVSVRASSAYDLGHIDGAINIPWRDVAQTANMALLSTTKPNVIYCYTGHTGGLAAYTLGILGYDTENLKWGMMNWSDDTANGGVDPWTTDQGLAVETTVNTLSTTYDLPDLEVSSSSVAAEIVQAAARRWLEDTAWTPIITASALNALLIDGDDTNDPVIISVRSAADYAAGHVPGAVNFTLAELAEVETLELLDPDADIVVYCYTGHTGGQATAMLNMLGYKAKNMKYGMMDWNVSELGAPAPFSGAPDYPTVPTTPGSN